MWFLSRRDVKKDQLQGIKKIRVRGWNFTIKKLNPFLDFSSEKMPQIFADFISRRRTQPLPPQEAYKKALDDMKAVIEAGLVEPKLVPVGKEDLKGKEDGVTVDDLFRDPELGPELYWAIVAHSLNKFRGLKGVFFSIQLEYKRFTALRKNTASVPATLFSVTENSA